MRGRWVEAQADEGEGEMRRELMRQGREVEAQADETGEGSGSEGGGGEAR